MDEKLCISFGSAARRLRKERGHNQEGFAYLCGLDRSYYGRVERGEQNVTITTAKKIAAALNMSLSDLFREVEQTET